MRTGIAALFGVSILYLQSLATDYFAPATELNAFTHTWSLGVEEQFWLLYPLPFAEVRGATAERCPVIDEALLQRELLAALGPGDVLAVRWHAAKPQYLHYPAAAGDRRQSSALHAPPGGAGAPVVQPRQFAGSARSA